MILYYVLVFVSYYAALLIIIILNLIGSFSKPFVIVMFAVAHYILVRILL